jgi:hypothetical protein
MRDAGDNALSAKHGWTPRDKSYSAETGPSREFVDFRQRKLLEVFELLEPGGPKAAPESLTDSMSEYETRSVSPFVVAVSS